MIQTAALFSTCAAGRQRTENQQDGQGGKRAAEAGTHGAECIMSGVVPKGTGLAQGATAGYNDSDIPAKADRPWTMTAVLH